MKKTKEKKGFVFLKYLGDHKVGLILYAVLYLISGGISIFATIYFAKFIELLTLAKYYEAIRLGLAVGVSLIIQRLLHTFNGLRYAKMYSCIVTTMSTDIAEQAFKISSQSYTNHSTGNFMQRIASDPRVVFDNIAVIIDYITDIVTNVVMFAYICTLNVWVGIISILGIVVVSIIEKIRRNLRRKHQKDLKRASEKVDSFLTEIVRSEKDVKSLNLESSLKERTAELYGEYKKKYLTFQRWTWGLWGTRTALIEILSVSVLLLSVVFMDLSLMTLASFMIIYANKDSFFTLTWVFGNIMNCFTDIGVSLERINELYYDDEYKLEKFGNRTIKNMKGVIEFKDVTYAYPEYREKTKEEIDAEKKYNKKHHIKTKIQTKIQIGKKKVLDKLSFKIEPNTTVAFVGVSGSGKSTILNLISKMYEVDSGRVLIDGVNINSLNKETIRSSISLVNQFPYIFDMTIKENLLLAKTDATDEEVGMAVQEAALDEFIATLPNGVDTRVGESGIKLSGGQKQRLAIARAMLRKSPIIIFDESTSSLDNLSQNQVKESIENIKGKSTIVIVAHRLSTIKNVDKIFFLDKGAIVDSGTFAELFKKNKEFKKIFKAENI